jgi:hypothetical protein
MRRASILLLFFASTVLAQQRPIYDADDFVDPRTRGAAMFFSHLVVGAAANLADDYRPLLGNGPLYQWANSVYWSNFQVDFKHARAYTGAPPPVQLCACQPVQYFPTPPAPNATPAAPPPGSKESLQFARYVTLPSEIMLRYRLTWTRQNIDTTVRFPGVDTVADRLHGHEQTYGLDADTHFRVGRHDVWGSIVFARNSRSGTTDNRAQNELAYTSRFPAIDVGTVSLMPRFTVGGVSGRGATGLNVVNPQLDVSYYHHGTEANLHLVYSPLATRSGANGWQTRHQIALFADRALFSKVFTSGPAAAPRR